MKDYLSLMGRFGEYSMRREGTLVTSLSDIFKSAI